MRFWAEFGKVALRWVGTAFLLCFLVVRGCKMMPAPAMAALTPVLVYAVLGWCAIQVYRWLKVAQ